MASSVSSVSNDSILKSIVNVDSSDKIKDIKNNYNGSSQSFDVNFKMEVVSEVKSISIPVTLRTRAGGGWSGKSLYITSSGVKVS
jgi:hypothetical protein